jgi:hypothetical protein
MNYQYFSFALSSWRRPSDLSYLSYMSYMHHISYLSFVLHVSHVLLVFCLTCITYLTCLTCLTCITYLTCLLSYMSHMFISLFSWRRLWQLTSIRASTFPTSTSNLIPTIAFTNRKNRTRVVFKRNRLKPKTKPNTKRKPKTRPNPKIFDQKSYIFIYF